MFISYRRAGRISVPAALAAAGALAIVAGIALVTTVLVGVAACGVWLVRTIARLGRIGRPGTRARSRDEDIIEGVVVESAELSEAPLEGGRRATQRLG